MLVPPLSHVVVGQINHFVCYVYKGSHHVFHRFSKNFFYDGIDPNDCCKYSTKSHRWIINLSLVYGRSPTDLLISKARHQMVVHHAGRLHKSVHNGRADKVESAFF